MKAIRVLSSAALLVALTAGLALAHPETRLDRRDAGRHERAWQGQRWGQQHRFSQGHRHGRITAREAARLRAGQFQILRMERIARADGFVSPVSG